MSRGRWALVSAALLVLLVLPNSQGAQGCLSPYGFKDFEPAPLVSPGGDVELAPVDVSSSTVDDMNHRMVSYQGDLYAFWMKETGRTEVSENLMCRVRRGGSWGDLLAVNNVVPEEGSFEGPHIRIAGYDVAVFEGRLWAVWSTIDPGITHGLDNDLVYRTYDGSGWSQIVELMPPEDEAEDVQPSIAVTDGGLLVAWTTNDVGSPSPGDQDVMVQLVTGDSLGPVLDLSPPGDADPDFLPELVAIPGGAFVTWYTRTVRSFGQGGSQENVVMVRGRAFLGGEWSGIQRVSNIDRGENIWVSMVWHEDRLAIAYQRGGSQYYYRTSRIIYREWRDGHLSPEQDITWKLAGSFNGKPQIGMAGDELRVYWHTNDDGLTLGTSYDLVWRASEGEGRWGPLEVFRSDEWHDLQEVSLCHHAGALYASWMMNVTYHIPPPIGTVDVWDVVAGPAHVPPDPLEGVSVTHRWRREVEVWGPRETIRFSVQRGGEPMGGTELDVAVVDPSGALEAVLNGTTDAQGRLAFDHHFEEAGVYTLNLTVEGHEMGAVAMAVTPAPPGEMDHLQLWAFLVVLVALAFVLIGHAFIRRRGVVRGRLIPFEERVPRPTPWLTQALSRALTRVVKRRRAQGFLQIPLFVLFVLSMVVGFFGTQVPQANFSSMVGWAYYLAGMMLLYAFFGRLWCYVEACGFVDTWAKLLIKRRRWLEWPEWLKNLWPGFVILLSGFWVEMVLSIDLYPWAVATYMLVTLLINLAISVNFGKRTYCRFVCRDGVVEELIARYSVFRIGVRTRPEMVSRGDPCIWKDEEKRPGYCSMCFSCVQNDPMVREATMEPATRSFAEDVYKPQAVHKDEAMAAIVLMGTSIPYMLGLTRAWWVGLSDVAVGASVPLGTGALAALIVLLAAGAVLGTWWAFRRYPGALTPIRRALVVLVELMLFSQLLLYLLGGAHGRVLALRSSIVLGCFVLPFAIVWLGELLVVRLTRDSRGETAWRLLERYGLVFIPVFLGVLFARNLPIVGTWGWAAWDILVATFTDFPGGQAAVEPRPFIDPALHFPLEVLALVVGLVVGAYAALQLSRRLYREEGEAMWAFAVHTGTLCLFVLLFVAILAMPPF